MVTFKQAAAILRKDPHQAEHFASKLGNLQYQLDFGLGQLSEASGLESEEAQEALRIFVKNCRPAGPSTRAFLDTTTLMNVQRLLLDDEPGGLTAETLMDLATFVDAVVLNDVIIHLPKYGLQAERLNRLLGDRPVLRELPVRIAGHEHEPQVAWLWEIWREAQTTLGDIGEQKKGDPYFKDRAAIQGAWARLTGGALRDRNIFDAKFVNDQWPSEVPQAISELLDASKRSTETQREIAHQLRQHDISVDELASIANEQNHRAEFNMALTQAIGVYYLPNTLRRPYLRYQQQRSSQFMAEVKRTKFFSDQFGEVVKKMPESLRDFAPLPPFLIAVLQQATTRGEFIERLAELRHQALGFRSQRETLDKALGIPSKRKSLDKAPADSNMRSVNEIGRALTEESKKLWPIFGGMGCTVAAALLAAVNPIGAVPLAVLGLTIIGNQLPNDDLRAALAQRILKPHLNIIRRVGDLAREMPNATPRAASIWGLDQDATERLGRRMKTVASFGLAA